MLQALLGHKEQAPQLASACSSPAGGRGALTVESTARGAGADGTKPDRQAALLWVVLPGSLILQLPPEEALFRTGKGN